MTQNDKELLIRDLCASINSERWMSLEDYPNEEWKYIDGFDNRYMVSNIGRVKTKEFTYTLYGKIQVKPEHILKTVVRKDGYCKVNLGNVWHIDSFDNKNYKVTDINGNHNCFPIYIQDRLHLYTHQDAKDGDVLVSESTCGLGTWYCIFKSLDGDESMTVYCYLTRDGRFETKKELCFDKDPYNTKPATKEQRNTLLKAMSDAGYTFDFEKKELKKISQRMVSAEAKEALYDKPAWSEEDEKRLQSCINILKAKSLMGKVDTANTMWLKSLKDRVIPQSKQEWSEEDECYMSECIGAIATKDGWSFEEKRKTKHWLKSIKDRHTWKPSDEQMEALHDLNLTGNISYAGQGQVLIELYNDLKKLIE